MPKRRKRSEKKMHPARTTTTVASTRGGTKRFKTASYFRSNDPRPLLSLFSKQRTVSMRYCDVINLSQLASGLNTSHFFRMNSCFDPDYTGGGHQPLGFDEYMTHYQHFTVLNARIKATALINGSQVAGILTVRQASEATAIANPFTCMEQPTSRVRYLPSGTGTSVAGIVSAGNLSQILGQDVRQDSTNAGSSSSNPNEDYFWEIAASGQTGAAASLSVIIEIDYRVMLHEPKQLLGS